MTLQEAKAIVNQLVDDIYCIPPPKRWDMQFGRNPWFSVGIHIDHNDPSITFHLPGILIYVGNCKQPGFKFWNKIVPKAVAESDNDS
jgi:hypothetical protein